MVRSGMELDEGTAARMARRASLAFFRVDADRNVVEMSPALASLTGFEADDIVGGSCLRVHRCPECLAGCGVFEHGVVEGKELELYRADGSTIRVRKSGRAYRDNDGRITGALEVVEALEHTAPASDDGGCCGSDAEHDHDEVARIREALEKARYRRKDAARLLGVSRTTLWRRMNLYGLR